ncbi:ATP-binding protein [Methylophaga sp. OBS4]|uniref:ATP-binding protein n=1 Tax=Methylophaga sp. OBS4 TaxID=2991935 RepID=UPI00224E356A|nr:ATP-binding protein [Methylophaga sp. OBS4]MCX4187024.1 ATP-binding protein [Methylophaga sp. OBS4]
MIESIAFRTQARTVDHLGREQIADCPTAISELWKNAYDAYASSVELNIYDGEEPVANILDNGHGMSYQEFVDRWLVVGTESKFNNNKTPQEDRNGLKPRPKQGQKGIGRLSSANLGPLLLLVSKRKNNSFVAALIDWRIFENPFLILSDIKIPVTQFDNKSELFNLLPELFEKLTTNVWGDVEDQEHQQRVEAAWQTYDRISKEENDDNNYVVPSEQIAQTIINTRFVERHIQKWQVWNEESPSGTALLLSGINYDLRNYLSEGITGPMEQRSQERFFETLSSFVDPFWDPNIPDINGVDPEFTYSVSVHKSDKSKLILGPAKEFNRSKTTELEHVVDGYIDGKGVFHGQIKVFGEWVEEGKTLTIDPPKDVKIHQRRDWKVGPVDLYFSTFEQQAQNTSHSAEEFKYFETMASKYAGFMVFRNSLRVLPYGRVDNDFFEIESRRSRHAGREFWNARRMFGRLALSREKNPNLKDKAGREGFIDNVAAKTLKVLIENILMRTGRKYFGTDSELRQTILPELQAANREEKLRQERNKLRKKHRSQFRGKLKRFNKQLPELTEQLTDYVESLKIESESELFLAQEELESFRTEYAEYRLSGAPQELGSLEDAYREYRYLMSMCYSMLERWEQKIHEAIQRIKPPKPLEVFEKQRQKSAGFIHSRIRKWKSEISSLHEAENQRISALIDERNKIFHETTLPLLKRVEMKSLDLRESLSLMEEVRTQIDDENTEVFESYIRALETLTESIDLEMLAIAGTEENDELRSEVERLNSLAQLGIAVEILGHELQSYDDMIGQGINQLPEEVQQSEAIAQLQMGYHGLTGQLRFLSPLKLSGQRVQKWITGQEIYEYLDAFYSNQLKSSNILFNATDTFKRIRVFEQPARLFPVFINLVNNSRYWLQVSDIDNKEIRLDLVGDKVFVSDNGPGVDELDVQKLFSLFFTRKMSGGRGVGLYLAKANLAAGGHKISYEIDKNITPLHGANFVIEFKGME